MPEKTLNVAIIGTRFMGKAHSSAWLNAPRFFDLPARPVLKVACGQDRDYLQSFADTWGWEEIETDWEKVVARPDIDIIDISVPQHLHRDIAVAAARAGKHIFCEKPQALTVQQSQEMLEAARSAGIVHYLNHNYRRVPAVMLARQLIDEGKIGRIYHWRGAYLQSWITDPNFPLTWNLRQELAGAGPHIDLNSHSIDLARFLVGEIAQVSAMVAHFITERPLPGKGAATFSAGRSEQSEMGRVTVEDAAFLVVRFENGALGSFDTSRFATGRKNYNTFEIYGSKGAITFDLERMNELQYFSEDDPPYAQGFRSILATESVHAYVANWWPPGHIIGYEHEFTHAVVDFVKAIVEKTPIRPNFEDGVAGMKVIEAALQAAATGQTVSIT
ncbi:MAG: Gfo/Idh/MocA family oxidoreductase [Anaerolineae bacterium]|jgi:predicted dehydrogenase|nr:Gfo/Idh/MocA family oxidoreductase [Anaerolineae bacterium]